MIKSGNSLNIFQKTNPKIEWSKLYADDDINPEYTLPIQHWLGQVEILGSKVNFKTTSQDIITLDISNSLNSSDTLILNPIIFQETLNLKLVATLDSVWTNGQDSLKSFSFKFLDLLNSPFNNNDFNTLNYESSYSAHYQIENQKVIWSKQHGIIQTPSFNFFPYTEEFHKIDKIENILNSTHSIAYDIFWNNIGDEIHTRKLSHWKNVHSKKN